MDTNNYIISGFDNSYHFTIDTIKAIIAVINANPEIIVFIHKETLGQYTKIVVETDEENPVTIAVIQSNSVDTVKGYRVRLTPKYN